MIEKEKIELLISAYLKKELLQEEKRFIDSWCMANEKNQQEFKRLVRLQKEQDKKIPEFDILRAKDNVKGKLINRLFNARKKDKAFIGTLSGLTGILIIGLFFSITGQISNTNIDQDNFIVKTEKGQLSKTILPDSTEVWLNSNTEIIYRYKNKERFVSVEGEAYFNVKKSEDTPFIVKTIQNYVKVFGTCFNVLSRNNLESSEVTLVEGSIGILDDSKKLIRKMSPGYQVIISNRGTIESEGIVDVENFVSWRTGRHEYRNVSLGIIGKRLEELYGVKVVFESQDLKEEKFRCVLDRNESILYTLEILKQTSGLDYTVSDQTIILKTK